VPFACGESMITHIALLYTNNRRNGLHALPLLYGRATGRSRDRSIDASHPAAAGYIGGCTCYAYDECVRACVRTLVDAPRCCFERGRTRSTRLSRHYLIIDSTRRDPPRAFLSSRAGEARKYRIIEIVPEGSDATR